MSLPKRHMYVYLSGPMTGYKDDNRPAFRDAAADLRAMGYSVISPDELDDALPVVKDTWSAYMRRDLPFVASADMGVLLPGWRMSKGSRLEAAIMNAIGCPLFEMVDGELRRIDPDMAPQIN
jgi:nucleoside 2-deoxyribosyltransferase